MVTPDGRQFDFETNSTTQSIRVEVRDEKNASLEATSMSPFSTTVRMMVPMSGSP